ncbi:MAG: homoserine dehydrogenase [Proteobacteria bacterium]|nr:homoserine dehydrogenase [Pseudomonadota bacterium]MDA1023691.1 homoserine dehydrogenase [Pseudomonadota bacterium]
MKRPLKIGIAGLGTVGVGTVRMVQEHGASLSLSAGRDIKISAVSARDKKAERGIDLGSYKWLDNALDLATEPDVDVVVELIGGADGIAKELCQAAIANGKHVVTANKAMIAHHGTALAHACEAAGVSFAYEAAVAGGIPIIKSLREGLAGNRISRVYGILNGTCNYILSAMATDGREFDDVLKECQQLGYAEADPSFDIDGIDAAHKLAILASVAFGSELNFDAVHIEGIRHVSLMDMQFADELGYRIKLLGIASVSENGLEQRVHPCMVPTTSPISHVSGSLNAVVADGDFAETIVHEGPGAGAGPTASAVIADVLDIARGLKVPTFRVPAKDLQQMTPVAMSKHRGAYYVRLMLVDKPGVFADIASALKDHEVSMESVLQRTRDPGEAVPVVMTLHETEEEGVLGALAEIEAIDAVVEQPRMIRIENL